MAPAQSVMALPERGRNRTAWRTDHYATGSYSINHCTCRELLRLREGAAEAECIVMVPRALFAVRNDRKRNRSEKAAIMGPINASLGERQSRPLNDVLRQAAVWSDKE